MDGHFLVKVSDNLMKSNYMHSCILMIYLLCK